MAESMKYRNLGRSGLLVSPVCFGNMTSGMEIFSSKKPEYDVAVEKHHFELMQKAISLGINFFDTAELYGYGLSETYLGNNLKQGGWDRDELIITTKFMPRKGVNSGNSRKRLRLAIQNSLKRLQLDNVDIIFLHRPDYDVPVKEQLSALNEMIENDYAYYWGTSEFHASQIAEIFAVCEKYGYSNPIVEQCEYNMLSRTKVEVDYVPLYEHYGLGTMTWSPLYGGMLSGKYNDAIPGDSRFGTFGWELDKSTDFLKALGVVANEVGCTQAQLALAWCLANKDVTSVLFGSTRVEQIESNVGALSVVDKLTPEVLEKLETILANRPDPAFDYRNWTLGKHRR